MCSFFPNLQFGRQVTQHPLIESNQLEKHHKDLSILSVSNFFLAGALQPHGVIAMRFSGFDADTNKLLDEAMASLSTDPALSLDLIYRSQNVVAQRITELATHGVRNRITLRDAAMKVIFDARAAEEVQVKFQQDGRTRGDPVNFGFEPDPHSHRQGEK